MNNVKILLLFILVLQLAACEKNNAEDVEMDPYEQLKSDLYGLWIIDQTNLMLTPIVDLSLYNVFAEPWYGEITVLFDSFEVEESVFELYGDDMGFLYWWADGFGITSQGDKFYLEYDYNYYLLETPPNFSNNNSLAISTYAHPEFYDTTQIPPTFYINGEIKATQITCEKGESYIIKNQQVGMAIDYQWIKFNEADNFEALVIVGDEIMPLYGSWQISEDSIKLIVDNTYLFGDDSLTSIKYTFGDSVLHFVEPVGKPSYLLNYLSVDKNDIEDLTYKQVFKKEHEH